MTKYDKLIFDISKEGRKGYKLPELDVEEKDLNSLVPEEFLRTETVDLPEVSENELVRHYTNLSNLNFGVDTGFYPLGSCTMKYNPKINEDVVALSGFANIHPLQPEETVQGALKLMYEAGEYLAEIAGMEKMTMQPAAGAHGELTGIAIIKAYLEHKGEGHRSKVIVPDSAHGTNPATAKMAGYDIVEIKSTSSGLVDVESLKAVLNDDIAALMLTNPNTLGLFEKDIKEISDLVHEAGGLVYYDGANKNAILGQARAGDMGFDVIHYNLHKTFSTPHGGGGPGSGTVGVKDFLVPFLPKPTVEKDGDRYYLDYDRPDSLGQMKDFYGHFGIIVRAYTYLLTMGRDGLKKASASAVLNANYLAHLLKDNYNIQEDTIFMHEFVAAGLKDPGLDITTTDVVKRLLDFGFHPPTIYFPLIVPEALMIEPTETESKETLEAFAEALNKIAEEARENPEMLKTAPHDAPVKRVDETQAARNVILKYEG